jgi:CheY-like chemotaxis protein
MMTAIVNGVHNNQFTTIVASPDPLFRRRILQDLATQSWPVEEVCGGAEALALLEGGKCQTLLLDRWLPDLDVDELVGTIRARHPHVEIMVLDAAISTFRSSLR